MDESAIDGRSDPPEAMATCPACGCQGHGLTYEMRCAQCRQLRWPILAERPGSGWRCRRCPMLPEAKRVQRQAAKAKEAATRRQKGAVTAMDRHGGTLDRKPA